MSEAKPKVLVVEDNNPVREALQELLGDDFCVLTASEGSEALILLRENKDIRAVTTSTLRGQQINGFCLAREMKNNFQGVKVILVTGAGDLKIPANIAECFNDIVRKPLLSSLVPKIRLLLI